MGNELKTKFIIDEGDSERKIHNHKTNLKDLNDQINNFDTKPFAAKYSAAFDSIDRRLVSTRNNFRHLSDVKLSKNQFDLISQGALAGEKSIIKLTNELRSLRKEAADPANAQFGKYYVSAIREVERDLERLERKFSSFNRQQKNLGSSAVSGGNGDNFSGAFGGRVFGSTLSGGSSGAILGGIAGGAVVAGIGATTSAVSALVDEVTDLGIESVKLSANFEQTENTLAVFAGGLNSAREELELVNKSARDTRGLRLETAEDGQKRLRALGFEAELSRNLISGLAKEKVISGSTNADLQRVIVNFTQLSAGSSRASQDIKEIIHAVPAMRSAFIDAFGTADPKKLKEFIETNPTAFFEKLARTMNAVQSPAIGLNESIDELKDTGIELGRAFGKPLLAPLTKDVQDLDGYLLKNKKTFEEWGQAAADAIRAASETIAESPQDTKGRRLIRRVVYGVTTLGASEGIAGTFNSFSEIGKKSRERQEAEDLKKKFSSELIEGDSNGLKYTFDPLTNTVQQISRAVDNMPSLTDRLDPEEAEKKAEKLAKRLEQIIDLSNRIAVGEVEQNLDLNKAIAVRDAKGDTLKIIKETAAFEAQAIRQQIALQNNLATDKIRNLNKEDFDSGKGTLIKREADANVSKLQNQLLLIQINEQKQLNEEIEKGKTKVKELGKNYTEAFGNLIALSVKNNPIATTFLEGEKAVKSLREQIKGLDADLQSKAISIQQKLNSNALFESRLDNNLSVFDLRERAREFRNPRETDEQRKNRIDDGARRSVNAGNFFAGGVFGNYGSFLANQAGGFDKLTDAQKRDIYEVRQFGNLAYYGNPKNSTFNSLNEKNLISMLASDRLRDADKNISVNERLQKQLAILDDSATTDAERAIAGRKLLALTSGLNPSEIGGNLRERIAIESERAADEKSKFDQELLKTQKESLELQKQQAENEKKLLEIAEKHGVEGLKIYMEIKDAENTKSKADVERATPADTGKQMALDGTYFEQSQRR